MKLIATELVYELRFSNKSRTSDTNFLNDAIYLQRTTKNDQLI